MSFDDYNIGDESMFPLYLICLSFLVIIIIIIYYMYILGVK